jgi:UDP-N-acetylglucosamine 2-epimerase (non-hydrolysing)
MIDPLMALFDIKPDYDLNLMQTDQSLEYITISALKRLGMLIEEEKPDFLVVQGDTTTAMVSSLAAFYKHVRIAHVEAGLRTWNKDHPYPEEVNRRIIDSLSDLYFAHTHKAKQNLLKEGVSQSKIEVTGNTVIDALLNVSTKQFDPRGTILENLLLNGRRLILVTAHRRENHGGPLLDVCDAIREIAIRYRDDVWFVYPVHLNPNVQRTVYQILKGIDNISLIPPIDYEAFVQLMKRAYLILTDSGGIQEEAPSLGKPVLVLRETTERPEAVEAGTVAVVGTRRQDIVARTVELLENPDAYERMSKAVNPYGDGKASERIVSRFLKEAGRNG